MAYLSLKLVLLLVAFSSGKSLEKNQEKKKIEKLMGKLDNLFDKSNGKDVQSKTTLDVGFLVENPYKHDRHASFAKSLDFVKSLSRSLHVSDMGNHVGLVTYGKHPYMVFDLNEYFAINDISDAINGSPKPLHGSNTGRALMFTKKQLFDSSSRPESRKALIILTSKSSTDKVYKAADVLRASGVMVYTIGVDVKDTMLELNDVASDPIEKHKFLTKSSELQDIVKPLTDLIWKDAQRIPQAPPPNKEDKKTKLAASKVSDEPPQARSNVEDSGRILDLNNGESNTETQDNSDDEAASGLPEPTAKPMEDQDNDPTMPPDSLPRESKKIRPTEKSDQATEITSSENPTMAPAAEPEEDEDNKPKSQDVTPAEPKSEPEPETTKPEQEKLAMPTAPSSTPAPLPTDQATFTAENHVKTPTSPPETTPTKSDVKQDKSEKLSMPTAPSLPSSTPAPLPTEQDNDPTMPPESLPRESKKIKPKKLSMPTAPSLPSSTPAPLPTKQASPKTEGQKLSSPTSSPVLTPTKADAGKPDTSSKSKPSPKASPTKAVAPKAAPTKSALFSAKKEPTMPAKELPEVAVGSRRSNITTTNPDPLDKFEEKSNKGKTISEADVSEGSASGPEHRQENDFQKVSKQTKDDEIVQDILEKANIFNESDSEDNAIQEAKLFNQSVSDERLHDISDTSSTRTRNKTKQAALPKPKPIPLPYTTTQPASNIRGKVCKARVDLVFLLDGSQATDKMRFTKSLTFVKDLVKSFSVSNDDAHVSVAVCSEKPHIVFDLNAFSDIGSIERAMSSIAYPSGKMFAGGCLNTIKSAIFENSGRHGVPKILYFMSGGDSNDHVALPSRALRDLGVQVFSLGLGTKYNARELKEIATAPYSDHVLATRYEILGLLRPFVTAQLCRGSGGKLLVPRATPPKHNKKKLLVKLNKKQSERQAKSKVPIQNESSFGKNILVKLKAKEERRKAALRADIRKKLHILLSKLGRKYHNENAIYRSIIYNINGHRDAGCKDYHVLCKTWGKKGFCKTSSKHGIDAYSVQRVCPKTCIVCYQ